MLEVGKGQHLQGQEERSEKTISRIVRDIVLGVLAGIVIEATVQYFQLEVLFPALPYIWFGILIFLTADGLNKSKRTQDKLIGLYKRLNKRRKMMSYLVVAIIGAGVAEGYWFGIKKIFEMRAGKPIPTTSRDVKTQEEKPKSEPAIIHTTPSEPQKVTSPHSSTPLPKAPIKQPQQPFAFQEQNPDVFTIELYRGSRAIISRADLTEKGWGPFLLGNEKPFSIYLENGVLYAEAKIYNGPGLPAVEVKKNDFVLRPMDWDRNFTDNALEIVNEKTQPVLQVIYKRKGLIHIQGIFSSPQGGAIYEAPELPEALPRIFKYPSWKYRGQYAESTDQDVSPFAQANNVEFVAFVRRWLTGPKPLLQIGNRNPGILHKEFMAFFYDKAHRYRTELLRRLGKKGNPEIDVLYKSLDPQNPNSIKAENSNASVFTKIVEDIEILNNELDAMNR